MTACSTCNRLREELLIAQFDANVVRREVDAAVASARQQAIADVVEWLRTLPGTVEPVWARRAADAIEREFLASGQSHAPKEQQA